MAWQALSLTASAKMLDEDHFNVSVDVRVSRQFLGWVFSLGESVRILGPEAVVDQMKAETQRLIGQYDIK